MKRVRRGALGLLTAVSLASAFLGVGTVSASAEGIKYQYVLGTSPLCSLEPTACPDITSASNGDRIEIAGTGTFVTGDDEVTGGGTFVHRNAAGQVLASGTWRAKELLSFRSFGPDPTGALPPNLEGGLARMEVVLHPNGSKKRFEATLHIDCAINSPTPTVEGVKLAVEKGLNFKNEVSGLTVFVNQGAAEED